MMLFKISLSNIKKSFKDYAIYFFTIVLGVAIFYVFNSLDSQTVLLNVSNRTLNIIKLMNIVLSAVSVFVSFILGFLIIYASRFLIKRRNKEFGIYLTLGMSKKKVSLILFIETLLIGTISLVVGIIFGILVSQLMSIVVANMFEANMKKFIFTFSQSACIKTIIYFCIMYFIVMIFNTISINKCKLIDLLNAKKKNESIKFKNKRLCTFIFILFSIVLGYTYYLVLSKYNFADFKEIIIPIILGSVSTFFIFWSLSGLLLNVFMTMKKTYYKGLNSFILRQFSSKINTMVFSSTIICLMLFFTICMLSSAYSIKESLNKGIEKYATADIQLYKKMNVDYNNLTVEEIMYQKKSIIDIYKENNIEIESMLENYDVFNIYIDNNFTFEKSLGQSAESIKEKYPFLGYDTKEYIMKVSEYNKVKHYFGNEELSLNKDEYIIVSNYNQSVDLRNIVLKDNATIEIFGNKLKPKYDKCIDGFVEISSMETNYGIFVVADEIVDEKTQYINYLVGNYKIKNQDKIAKFEENLYISRELLPVFVYVDGETKINIKESSIGLSAMASFIGIYLGIVFLISSAAILALKELSECTDNKERFNMIRNLGADEKMINRALFKQTGIFFMFPLLIAIIHSIVGIMVCIKILDLFIMKAELSSMTLSIIVTAIIIIMIYGGYFIITYFSVKNMLKENK